MLYDVCFSNNKLIAASSIKIYAGNLMLDDKISTSSQSRRVKAIFVHENFNMRSLINDIALLKVYLTLYKR